MMADYVTICLLVLSVCMKGEAGPASISLQHPSALIKRHKTKAKASLCLTIILIPLLKPGAWDLSGSWPPGLIELFKAPV